MISLVHHNGIAITKDYEGFSIIDAIYKCALEYPEEYLIIYKKDVEIEVFKTMLPELNHDAYFFSSLNHTSEDLGYIEDSPFLNINKTVKYPTWMKGTAIVCIHSKLVNRTVGSHSSIKNYLYWLNSIGKLSLSIGVLNYQIPLIFQKEEFSDDQLYKFTKQHYKTRWVFILLLCHLMYEKRFPLLAFIKSFFYSTKYIKIDVHSLQKVNVNKVNDFGDYDVVVPTMGRSNYLKDVLKDLNNQNILPENVIIIEQNAAQDATSDLDFVRDSDWNFKIIHEFTTITGACRARNRALAACTSKWVLLFDDDVRVEKTFSSQISDFIKNRQVKCLTFSCLQKGETENLHNFLQWPAFGSGCSIVHREVIEKCAFDIALEHGYGEDVDYGMQVRNAGYDVIYTPHIEMLHLKAPIGGFRKPYVFPWQKDEIQPKPSPQIMYHRRKNYTPKQLLGYKLTLFIKFYKDYSIKNPITYYNYFKKAWSKSLYWSQKLAQDAKV